MRAAIAMVMLPAIAAAQPPARPLTPGQVLARIEATYQQPAQLTARFEQTVTNVIGGKPKRSSGTLLVAKPDKLRFDYTSAKGKPDKHFIFDGQTLWVIEHVNLQVLQHHAGASPLPGAIAFFLGAGKLASEFDVGFPKARGRLVPGATVLELVPRQPTAQYARIDLVIDPATWQVTRTTVVDSSGNTNTFAFSKVDTRTPIKATTFQFHPRTLPSYRVVRVQPQPPAPAPRRP
jgi:outer membrane lipoprotein carrier protein